jgi:tRNA pseudouridine38-40 synthase
VHASGQVVHFNSTAERTERGWLRGINTKLPADISVHWARPVNAEFHARYSALSRSYRYLILNRVAPSALYRHRAWWVYQPLDVELMHQAMRLLIGRHDFSAFRAAGCQASTPVREVKSADVQRHGDWIIFSITANAFLQHMVRNIAGLLFAVGAGQQPPEWAGEVLECRDRTKGGIAAPAQGLTLTGVEYPEEFSIPSQFVYDAIL